FRDDNGDLIREQEKVTYQNMFVRYGKWSRIRGQLFVYIALLAIAHVYKSHSDAVEFFQALKTVDGRYIQCCCDVPKRLDDIKDLGEKFEEGGMLINISFVIMSIFGLTCMLWERFIGRRKMLLSTMILGVLSSVILMFPHQTMHHIGHLLLNLSMVSTILISIVNMLEMLPYESRFLSVSMLTFVSAESNAIAIIREEEQVVYDQNPGEGGRNHHKAVAKKIFEDLV
ncbi:hypothetical protein PFISCL1PPCAC_5097, partial [Pristionchus fissidentatus]